MLVSLDCGLKSGDMGFYVHFMYIASYIKRPQINIDQNNTLERSLHMCTQNIISKAFCSHLYHQRDGCTRGELSQQ